MTLSPRAKLGPYEVVAPLGAGGMGEVYRAHDTRLGRDIAIKLLPMEVSQDAERLARFKREAHLLASLNHPHVASVHGLEELDGHLLLVMELVEGEDLAQRLKRGAIPIDEALQIARQIAEALEEAHEHGIVHRDLKPANIKLTRDGKVKVLDFGLAKAYEGGWRAERAGRLALADADESGVGVGCDPGDGGVHVAGAGARKAGGQARRHLGLRRRALRDADREAPLSWRDNVGHPSGGAEDGSKLESAPGRDAAANPRAAAAVSHARSP